AAVVINISSGLAFVPLSRVPVYCATKAAVHSFTISLRHQLRNTTIKVIELIPPYVDTQLDAGRRVPGGRVPMPLDPFIAAAMEGLASGTDEVPVGEAAGLYQSNGTGDHFRQVFSRM